MFGLHAPALREVVWLSTDLVQELGVLLEEKLKCKQLVLDTLNLVELVTADDKLESGIALFKSLDPLFHLRVVPNEKLASFTGIFDESTDLFSVSVRTSIPIGNTPTSTKRSSVWMPLGVASSESTRDTVCLKCLA
jgi:hypothetical protein